MPSAAPTIAYQWIVGEVSVNYHTISDFRTDHGDLLNDLLTRSVAVLLTEGLVDLERVVQDGMRVRAVGLGGLVPPPAHSGRGLGRGQRAGGDETVSWRQIPPAPHLIGKGQSPDRAVRERTQRVQDALNCLPELEAQKKPAACEKDKARCSTTDPEATVMKMANGGFNPAYNVHFATDTQTQVIVGVEVLTIGSEPRDRWGRWSSRSPSVTTGCPVPMLVDGGFAKHEDIEAVSQPEGVAARSSSPGAQAERRQGRSPRPAP